MARNLKVILAAAAVVAACFVAIVFFTVAKRASRRKNRPEIPITQTPAPAEDRSSSSRSEPKPFSMEEIQKATNNFSPDLKLAGDGSFGPVYKARLPNPKASGGGFTTVAVKKLSPDAFHGFSEFRTEVETLKNLTHPNIVNILGYCSKGPDRVLIYDYLDNGSLDRWLRLDDTRLPLSWETRVKIVRGVASGLAYMHELESPIIHRDVRPEKVLLDKDFEPCISDFGLARRIEGDLSYASTKAAGKLGYMPPEYLQGATMATAMGDVYSFGILMLEVSTGVRPDLPMKEEGSGKGVRLVDWARKKVAENLHMEILDGNMSRAGVKESGVVEFFRIAVLCTSDLASNRPPMKKVVEELDQILT